MDIEVNKQESQSSANKKSVDLDALVQDQEVAEFYHFVHENNLREKAITILAERIDNLDKLNTQKLTN